MQKRKSKISKSLARIKKHLRSNWFSKRTARRDEMARAHLRAPPIVNEWATMFDLEDLEAADADRIAREEALYILQKTWPNRDLQFGSGAALIMNFVGRDAPGAPRKSPAPMEPTDLAVLRVDRKRPAIKRVRSVRK